MIQNYVWRLRGVLGERRRRGDPHARARLRAPDRSRRGRRPPLPAAAVRGEPRGRRGAGRPRAREALALWRGPALADVADEPFAAPEIRRLEELRLEAAELAIDADLAAGRHRGRGGDRGARRRAPAARAPPRAAHAGAVPLRAPGRGARGVPRRAQHARRRDRRRAGPGAARAPRGDPAPGPFARRRALRAGAAARARRRRRAAARRPRGGAGVAARAVGARAGRRGRARRLLGAAGMGKTRLAAEIAGEAHGEGATVLYAAGAAAPEAALAAIARARRAPRRPTLLVVDDADRAGACGPRRRSASSAARPAWCSPRRRATGGPRARAPTSSRWRRSTPRPSAGSPLRLRARRRRRSTRCWASGGVPERVHEVASEWARREAARRVDAVAGRAAAGRVQARALEPSWRAASRRCSRRTSARSCSPRPRRDGRWSVRSRDSRTFDVDDAEYFFGREQLVAELVARLVGTPLLAIVGPVGQRQVVGVARRAAAGARRRRAARQRGLGAGADPARRASRARARRAPTAARADAASCWRSTSSRRCSRPAATSRSARRSSPRSSRAAQDPDGRRWSCSRCAPTSTPAAPPIPELARLIGANNVLVGPMSRDELRRAITRPAERVGLRVEPDLEDALVADVEGQPGALPLLSTALLELWQQRSGRRLELAAYRRAGGVGARWRGSPRTRSAASSRRSRTSRARCSCASPARTRTARSSAAASRWPSSRRSAASAWRACSTSSPAAGCWPSAPAPSRSRTRRSCASGRGCAAGSSRTPRAGGSIATSARRRASGSGRPRPGRALPRRAARLRAGVARRARAGAQRRRAGVPGCEPGRERARAPPHAPRARGRGRAAPPRHGAALVALDGRERARDQARAAEAQRLGAQALNEPTLDRSLLLARQAVELDDTPATRGKLLAALRRSPAAIGVMRGDGDASTVAASGRPDARGRRRQRHGRLPRRPHAAAGRKPHPSGGLAVDSLAFSPDGTPPGGRGWDQPAASSTCSTRGPPAHRAPGSGDPSAGTVEKVELLARLARGRRADPADPASAQPAVALGCPDGPPDRPRAGHPRPPSACSGSAAAGWSPRAEDNATVVRDAATLRAVRSSPWPARRRVEPAGAGWSRSVPRAARVRLLDLRTGAVRPAAPPRGPVTAHALQRGRPAARDRGPGRTADRLGPTPRRRRPRPCRRAAPPEDVAVAPDGGRRTPPAGTAGSWPGTSPAGGGSTARCGARDGAGARSLTGPRRLAVAGGGRPGLRRSVRQRTLPPRRPPAGRGAAAGGRGGRAGRPDAGAMTATVSSAFWDLRSAARSRRARARSTTGRWRTAATGAGSPPAAAATSCGCGTPVAA